MCVIQKTLHETGLMAVGLYLDIAYSIRITKESSHRLAKVKTFTFKIWIVDPILDGVRATPILDGGQKDSLPPKLTLSFGVCRQ